VVALAAIVVVAAAVVAAAAATAVAAVAVETANRAGKRFLHQRNSNEPHQ